MFSEDSVSGNCGILKHVINIKDSNPIKQAPRRIPSHLREEVNRIIDEMKSH